MATLADHKYIWKADYAIITLVISCAAFVLSASDPFASWNTDEIIGFLLSQFVWIGLFGNLAFGAGDVLVYKWTGNWGGELAAYKKTDPSMQAPYIRGIAAYRWPQHAVFFSVIALVAVWEAPLPAFGMFLLWATGFTDWAYYIISKSEFGETYSWLTGWFWIFPAGFIWKLIGKPIPKWAFFTNVIIGFIGWLLIGGLL